MPARLVCIEHVLSRWQDDWLPDKRIPLEGNLIHWILTAKICMMLTTVVNPFASEAVYTRNFFFRPHVGQRVNTHSVFWELGRKPCQHATRGCDKRWMTCIHAGVSRSPREHASVPPDKRHCHQGTSEWNGMEWNEWMDFCLIPLSTTGSVEVPGTNL